jgi:hypothetical protein
MMILKRFYFIWGMFLFLALNSFAQRKTTLSAEVNGYKREMVYFDCLQSPFFNAEFHNNPGEEHLYSFNTKNLVCMLLNGQVNVLLLPGDSIHVAVQYDNNLPPKTTFSGDKKAVAANNMLQGISELKRQMRYKSQLLACVVVDIKPQKRIEDSRILLTKVQEMVKKAGKQLTPLAAEYILSTTEAAAYTSYMEYPQMYAETRKLAVSDQGIGDYWKIMDGVKLRSTEGALASPDYVSFLMRYCFYENEKKATLANQQYTAPRQLEEMFKTLSLFYSGALRDAVLYQLLVNFTRNGKELERVRPLYLEYKNNYNINKEYLQILDKLLE